VVLEPYCQRLGLQFVPPPPPFLQKWLYYRNGYIPDRTAPNFLTSTHGREGPCENLAFMRTDSSLWLPHPLFIETRSICPPCYSSARRNGELPDKPVRTQRKHSLATGPCMNTRCNSITTISSWNWCDLIKAYICSACYQVLRKNGFLPDRISNPIKSKRIVSEWR